MGKVRQRGAGKVQRRERGEICKVQMKIMKDEGRIKGSMAEAKENSRNERYRRESERGRGAECGKQKETNSEAEERKKEEEN